MHVIASKCFGRECNGTHDTAYEAPWSRTASLLYDMKLYVHLSPANH